LRRGDRDLVIDGGPEPKVGAPVPWAEGKRGFIHAVFGHMGEKAFVATIGFYGKRTDPMPKPKTGTMAS